MSLSNSGSRHRNRSSTVAAFYTIGGVISGFAYLPLIPLVRAIGLPRDSSVAIALFGFMPLLIIVLGWHYRGFLLNLVGVLVSMLAWAVGYALACKIWGGLSPGMIALGLINMGQFMAPAYVVLALLVYALVGWKSGWNGR